MKSRVSKGCIKEKRKSLGNHGSFCMKRLVRYTRPGGGSLGITILCNEDRAGQGGEKRIKRRKVGEVVSQKGGLSMQGRTVKGTMIGVT